MAAPPLQKFEEELGMEERWSLGIEVDRCIGCYSCVTACKMENGVPLGSFLNRVVKVGPLGTFPHVEMRYLFQACLQCRRPPCLEGCSAGALSQREDGIVVIDPDRCNGCQECLERCPYGALAYVPERNHVMKCHLCAHRLDRGERPMCVEACMTGVLTFGDLNDLRGDGHPLGDEEERLIPRAHLGTGPAVFYRTVSARIRVHLGLQG